VGLIPRFKLPRNKYSFNGLRTNAGDYISAGLPNITGESSIHNNPNYTTTGAFSVTDTNKIGSAISAYDSFVNLTFDASLSNPIYGNSDTVQPPVIQCYLMFYCN